LAWEAMNAAGSVRLSVSGEDDQMDLKKLLEQIL
jgi:hypothetical protein